MNFQVTPELILAPAAALNPMEWSTTSYLLVIVLLLLARAIHPSGSHWYTRLTREVLFITPAIFLYFAVRGLVTSREEDAVRNARRIIDLQSDVGLFYEPAMQAWILDSEFLTKAANWIYIWGHWPVVAGTLIWLIIRHPDAAGFYRNAFLISGTVAIFIFLFFPVAPPRLLPDLAVVDTVAEQSRSYRVLQPPALTNPFAAMPSLHFGWNLLMGIAIVRHASLRAMKVFGILMPVMMFLGIVLTANHYILDGVAGGAMVVVSLWLVHRFSTGEEAPGPGAAVDHESQSPRSHVPAPARHPLQNITVPITIAHRAGNSIASAREAEAAGSDVLEADIWLYRGRLEVRHSKTLGPIPIRWDRWWIEFNPAPSLELSELLNAISPDTRVMLDLKGCDQSLPRRVLEESRRARPEVEILVCSQNWRMLAQLREEEDVAAVYSIGNRRQLRRSWSMLQEVGIDAVSIDARLLNPESVRRLRERVPVIITWPINDRSSFERVRDLDVTGVISDSPALLDDISREKGNRSAEVLPVAG